MDAWPQGVLMSLARASVVQLAMAGLLACVMRGRWPACPRTCRLACVLVLLAGWVLVPVTVAIPWYEPVQYAASREASELSSVDAPDASLWASGRGLAIPADPGLPGGSLASLRFGPTEAAAALRSLLVGIWGAVAVGIALAMLRNYLRFCSRLRTVPARPEWLAEWADLLAKHNVGRRVPLRVTRDAGPMLCIRPAGPTVLVPQDLWESIAPAARRSILRHELAHYLRGDAWLGLLVRMLAIPQWFQPASWWSVRMFEQCGEWLCDQTAASTRAERLQYAQALAQLASLRTAAHPLAACAHSHPLVQRVRLLLTPPVLENAPMRRIVVLVVAGVLFLLGAIRVELVARDILYTKESVHEKVGQLDEAVRQLASELEGLKRKEADLKKQVDEQMPKLVELYQAAALDGAGKLGDEGAVLLALAAGSSRPTAVRRKALADALRLGDAGRPVLVRVFPELSDADRVFLVEQLAVDMTDERVTALAHIAVVAASEVQDAVIAQAMKSKRRRLLFAAMFAGVSAAPELAQKMIAKAAQLEDEDGVLLLYAVARYGQTPQCIAALKAAAGKKQEGTPVLAAALHSQEPAVRQELVRTAKAIGGEVADYVVQMALNDPDEALRAAAQKALEEARKPAPASKPAAEKK
jgi:beta-lactamase regulating signal transducer with metallopeptidase domain